MCLIDLVEQVGHLVLHVAYLQLVDPPVVNITTDRDAIDQIEYECDEFHQNQLIDLFPISVVKQLEGIVLQLSLIYCLEHGCGSIQVKLSLDLLIFYFVFLHISLDFVHEVLSVHVDHFVV